MKHRKNKVNPLIPVLAAVSVVLAIILLVLILTAPEKGEGAGGTEPHFRETVGPTGEPQDADNQTLPSQPHDAEGNSQIPENSASGGENMEETTPAQIETEPDVTKNPSQEGTGSRPTEAPSQEGTGSDATEPTVQENTEPVTGGIPVNTPYCVLTIPEEWEEDLSTEITEGENGVSILFYCNLTSEKIPLYTLHFGGTEGDLVGTWLTDEGVKLNITLEVHEIKEKTGWSAGEQDMLYAMQETVNSVIKDLDRYQAFTAA